MIKKLTFMSLSTLARLLTGVVLFILMARAWGATVFGTFVYPYTIATLAVMIVDYGFGLQLVRDVGRDPGATQRLMHRALAAKLLLALVLLVAAVPLVPRIIGTSRSALLLWLLLGATLLNSFGMFWNLPFRGLGRFDLEARVVGIANLVHFGVVGGTVLAGGGVVPAALGFLISRAVYLGLSLAAYGHEVGAIDWGSIRYRQVPAFLGEGLPFGVFVALGTLYFQVDTLLVQHFLGAEGVGLYQAGVRVLMAALVVPEVVTTVYLPEIASVGRDRDRSLRLANRMTRHLLMLGLIGVAVVVIAPRLLVWVLLGRGFEQVAPLLPLFGIVLFLRYGASAFGVLLTVADRQVARTLSVLGALLVSLGCNALLIPRVGLRGAVVASILTHVYLVGVYAVLASREFRSWMLDWRSALLCGIAAVLVLTSLGGRVARPGVAVAAIAAALLVGVKRGEARRLIASLVPGQ